MRIGLLTGGGDVPGLNACLKAFVARVAPEGHEVIGIRRGWAGLLDVDLDDPSTVTANTTTFGLDDVRTIDRSGGTVLHTSRTNPLRVPTNTIPRHLATSAAPNGPHDFTDHVVDVLDHLDLDALVAIGGDDTLAFAVRLAELGVPVVGIPKTMDNDVFGTDYCVGFSTAVTRGVELIHELRTSTGSHERLAVIELFGRASGETSLMAAYLSSVDRAIISEVPFDPERLAALLMEDKRRNPSNYAMCTISEGAQPIGSDELDAGVTDAYGRRVLGGIAHATGDIIMQLTGQQVISQPLGYLLRSGRPDALDLMVATNFAVIAGDLVTANQHGRMVAVRSGTYTNVPIEHVTEGTKRVDVDALYDVDSYRPKVRDVAGKPMFLS